MSRLVPGLVCLLLLAVGCGSRPEQREGVSGVVYYRGQPLRGGTIVFVPDADQGNTGSLASGEIKADGSYSLRTGEEPGACVGPHKVTVAPANNIQLPAHYTDPHKSGQHCEVKKGQPNRIDFHLE